MIATDLQPEMARRAAAAGPVRGLYAHVPFCFHKCHYCDFYSVVDAPGGTSADDDATDRHTRFVDRLIQEMRLLAGTVDWRPRTVFFGGGTPTLLSARRWGDLLAAMAELRLTDAAEEFTVEANPETVTPELARTLAAGGVNRVSIGAQSFDSRMLKALERWHEPARVAEAVATFRDAGIDNVNLDLIFAIPGQTIGMLDADLDALLAIDPQHLSCYSLIFEPHTPLTQRMKLGQVRPLDEDLERAMYERVIDRLADAGYEHYEVSNWARRVDPATAAAADPSPRRDTPPPFSGGARPAHHAQTEAPSPHRCRHNLAYWTNDHWLGVGPSASSHLNGLRWKNAPHIGKYLASTGLPPTTDHETLEDNARRGEALMLRLRLIEGAPLTWLHDLLPDTDPRWQTIDDLTETGLLEQTATHLRLTRDGLFLADAVLAQLL